MNTKCETCHITYEDSLGCPLCKANKEIVELKYLARTYLNRIGLENKPEPKNLTTEYVAKIEELTDETGKLRDEIVGLEMDIKELEDLKDQAKDQAKDYDIQIRALNNSIQNLNDKVENLEVNIEEYEDLGLPYDKLPTLDSAADVLKFEDLMEEHFNVG